MSVDEFQKAVTYIREVQEITLFATMADSRWYMAFGASPLFFVMLPFIGFLLTINAFTNGYRLAKANNKNIDHWFGFIVSVLCAVLASVSLYGAALSAFMGFSFAAGPWFFFSSLIAATIHQSFTLGLNLYRAYESLPSSAQRMHYLQAAFNNLFILGLLSAAFGAVLFVMLFPGVAPLVGTASAIVAVTFTGFDILWRMIPHHWKLSFKNFLGIGKPELVQNNSLKSTPNSDFKIDLGIERAQEKNPNHYRLFTRFDYSAEVRRMDLGSAKCYLNQIIVNKIQSFQNDSLTHGKKIEDKIGVLNVLKNALNDSEKIPKEDMLKNYPLAFQNFLAPKGDVEQIFDAVIIFKEKLGQNSIEELTMSAPY